MTHKNNVLFSRQWIELAVLISLAGLTTLVFWNGKWDIALAHLFYSQHTDNPWPNQSYWLWRGLYDFGRPSVLLTISVALLIVLSGFRYRPLARFRYRAIYFIAVASLGPGLIVNLVIKDNWGRPRPREIVEFNGSHPYQPPLVISDTGKKSFVCGHCSSGYMFFALYFIVRKGRLLVLCGTLFYSFLIGIGRMTAGGHFVSDILWSGYVVFGLSWFLYYFVFNAFSPPSSAPSKHTKQSDSC